MLHFGKSFGDSASDPLGRGIASCKLRIFLFKVFQPAVQAVVFDIFDFRIVEPVVSMIVVSDLFNELRVAGSGIRRND